MRTIHCPTCKRVLHAPEEAGDLRVVCPGCNVPFAVIFEDGVVRTLSTSVLDEQPVAKSLEEPGSVIEADEPPQWIPPVAVNVENDEAARRTRRIQYTYVIASIILFLILLRAFATEWEGLSVEKVVESAFIAPLMSVFIAVFVGYFILPAPADPYRKRDKALRRMSKALRADAPIPTDDAPASPPDAADPFPNPAHVQPKQPPA